MSKKFKHLKSQIDISAIENAPIHLYDEERLPETKNHFNKIKEKYSSNEEIVNAVDSIINKIDNIINLWKTRFSWEIMKAANNVDYIGKHSKKIS